jgi:DNA-binding CsgD family transcriptional regulator
LDINEKKSHFAVKIDEIIFLENMYEKYFKIIHNIKFTPREIDVISCLMNGKNPKAIAKILSTEEKILGVRGIEVQIHNIKQKIGGNNRQDIINFIENSDKLLLIRDYYSTLLIQKEFRKVLQLIAKLLELHVESYLIIYLSNTQTEEDILLITVLKSHLRVLSPESFIEVKNISVIELSKLEVKGEKQYIVYILAQSDEDIYEQVTRHIIKYKAKHFCVLHNKAKDLEEASGIIQEQDNIVQANNNMHSAHYINLSECENYYFLLLEILKIFFPILTLEEHIKSFKEKYSTIRGDIANNKALVSERDTKEINAGNIEASSKYLSDRWQKRNIIITLVSCIVIVSFLFCYNNTIKNIEKQKLRQLAEAEMMISSNIKNTLPKFFEELSLCNLDNEQVEKNYNVVKQFSQVIKQINSGSIQQYFDINTLKSDELINCLYNLSAIATYILFKEHDSHQAEKILRHAKNLAEKYVSDRSRLQLNFDKLSPTEIYTELLPIKDLPEMYATINYFLGRSYIYQKNIDLAEKYFVLSKYFGQKMGLFIAIMSDVGGLAIIKGDRINIDTENGRYEQAKKDINECINIYKNIKENSKKYKKDYRPNNYDPTFIIPKEDTHNIIECNRRIIGLYTKLILITEDINEKENYLKQIATQLMGNGVSSGILDTLIRADKNLNRIVANSYNTLGYSLLSLLDQKVDLSRIKNIVMKKLNLNNGNDLEIIKQTFELAKSLSRNTEFTKADAYDGLINVFERIINQGSIDEEAKGKLSVKMQEFREKRDEINQKLMRSNN